MFQSSHEPRGQEPRTKPRVPSDPFYAVAFGIITAGLMIVAARGGLWWLLVWPAGAFGVVGGAYLCGSVSVFGKRADGTRDWRAALLLGPYLACARIVWELQVVLSREAAWQRVNDGLIVARRLRAGELPDEVGVICDLTAELLDPAAIRTHPGYVCRPVLDANVLPVEELISLVASLSLRTASERGDAKPDAPAHAVLIHCANGHGRTGLVAAAWLVATRQAASAEEALTKLRAARPGIRLRRRQRRCLEEAVERLGRAPLAGPARRG